MNTSAILMMLLAMVVIWGGLAVAIVNLIRRGNAEPSDAHRDL